MDTGALIKVELHVPPQHEEEFNAWYELEHIPQVLAMNGFVSGRRYVCDDAFPKYLALYETVDTDVEKSPSWKSLGTHPTPWSRRMATFFGQPGPTRKRQSFERLADTRTGSAHPGAVYLIDSPALPFDRAQIEATARHAAGIAGCTGYRFLRVPGGERTLEIFDLETPGAGAAADWSGLPLAAERERGGEAASRHLYTATGTPVVRADWG